MGGVDVRRGWKGLMWMIRVHEREGLTRMVRV